MKRIFERFQQYMVAATFAEAGEWETARRQAPARPASRVPEGRITPFDTLFTAITFAEHGMADQALRLVNPRPRQSWGLPNPLNELGLQGAYLVYGTIDC